MSTALAELPGQLNHRGFWRSIEADIHAYELTKWSAVYRLFTISTWGLVLTYRVAHWFVAHHVPLIPGLLHAVGLVIWGADISPAAELGAPLRIAHSVGIVIGAGCTIGSNCHLFHNVTVGRREGEDKSLVSASAMPVIGDDVTLCAGAVVIGPLRVGNGSIVGAHAVVLHDVPAYTAVAGIPAAPIRHVGVPHAIGNLPAKYKNPSLVVSSGDTVSRGTASPLISSNPEIVTSHYRPS